MRRSIVFFLGSLLVLPATVPAAGEARPVTVVSGSVRDHQGQPLGGVTVHAKGANLSDVSTDPAGWFRLAIVDLPGEIPIRFSSPGFLDEVRTLARSESEIKLEVVLERTRVDIEMTQFERGRRIRGRVSGLAPGEHRELKVLVYVLTDKWYVHPEAVATPGSGFAVLDLSGSWEIGTVWRGHQAVKLALAVVPKDSWAPPTIEPGEVRPEDAVQARLTPLALSVLDAPPGI